MYYTILKEMAVMGSLMPLENPNGSLAFRPNVKKLKTVKDKRKSKQQKRSRKINRK